MVTAWPYTIRPMRRDDIPAVIAIDRHSFPLSWPASAFSHELNQPNSCYYVLLKPSEGEGSSVERKHGAGWRHWLSQLLAFTPLAFQEESRVIGYVGFRLQDDDVAHISTIAVHIDWRGRGLGDLLLLTALEKAMETQASLVTLEMRTSNRVAHRLYSKYGFQALEKRKGYYQDGEDAWIMAVSIQGDAYQARLDDLRRELKVRLQRSG